MEENQLAILIAEAKEGDKAAFRAIFEALHARVFSYASSHVKERDDALDITQETFIELWKALPGFQYRSDEEFYGFVFLVAKRKIGRLYKKKRARPEVALEESDPRASYTEEHEDHRFLVRQIETLAEKYQELLRLRYWGGMRLAEAAAVLGISEDTAKVWHHRALNKLRERMEDYK
jgi:RNA polymerase sigma-70 factor (ECF subfamily)